MIKGVIAFVALFALGQPGCGNVQPEGLRVSADPQKSVAYPVFGNPIVIEGSGFVAIPFSLQLENIQRKQILQSSFGFSSGQYYSVAFSPDTSMREAFGSYSGAQNPHWNNLAFCEKDSGKVHLLLDRRAVICRAYFPNGKAPVGQTAHYLLFGIAEADTNRDGYINEYDAVVLYRADLDGRNLKQLTPENTSLKSVIQDGGPNDLYVRIVPDTNGNHMFDEPADQAVLLRINLESLATTTVISDDVRRRAQSIVEHK